MKIDLSEVNKLLNRKEYVSFDSVEILDSGDVLIRGTHSDRFSPLVRFLYNMTTKEIIEK